MGLLSHKPKAAIFVMWALGVSTLAEAMPTMSPLMPVEKHQ
jgi:hypothetical protein